MKLIPGGVGNVSDSGHLHSAMVKNLLGSTGRQRNGAAHRQAEAFRRRAFRQVECTFGKRIGRVSAMVLQCVDNTGIEIRPEVRKGFRKTAPDQLDIALAGGPIPAEEAAHRFAFMIVMARVQCVLLVIA